MFFLSFKPSHVLFLVKTFFSAVGRMYFRKTFSLFPLKFVTEELSALNSQVVYVCTENRYLDCPCALHSDIGNLDLENQNRELVGPSMHWVGKLWEKFSQNSFTAGVSMGGKAKRCEVHLNRHMTVCLTDSWPWSKELFQRLCVYGVECLQMCIHPHS